MKIPYAVANFEKLKNEYFLLDFKEDKINTNVNRIRRLTIKEENAINMLENLQSNGTLPYDNTQIHLKFNINSFFERVLYTVSLFYLGMVTYKDYFHMENLNKAIKAFYAHCYNVLEKIEVSKDYTEFKNLKFIVELKYFSKTKAQKKKIMSLEKPFEEDIHQLNSYTNDLLKQFPEYNVSKFIIYTIGSEKIRFF